ncbi:RNA polymerase sigma factor [Carboxylicivirga sp. N1Y90]|uniref:RNA polymerase sigma factor n=1 Tax=Carboxylicivirga fragile TaxID=3417571 RepID=UPI003D338250|nr:sigma-70 family RNA polymerase sigma factor [Marinilabiliaceae bacterium N1Y90]
MKKERYTDNELLEGVYNREGKIIKHIMNMVWGPIQSFVSDNSGNKDEAMNIIHEAFVAIYSKTEKPQLTCAFSTYFYSICKNLWLNELRKRKSEQKILNGIGDNVLIEADGIEEKKLYEKRRLLYLKYFKKITKVCQDVLRLVSIGFSNEDITSELAFSSVQYMKNRRSMCNKKLIEMIKADPQFKELKYGL